MRAVIDGATRTRAQRRFADVPESQISNYCGQCGIPLAFAGWYAQSEVCSRECWEESERDRLAGVAARSVPTICALPGCTRQITPGPFGRKTCSDAHRRKLSRLGLAASST
jgi:hypothetical protein